MVTENVDQQSRPCENSLLLYGFQQFCEGRNTEHGWDSDGDRLSDPFVMSCSSVIHFVKCPIP